MRADTSIGQIWSVSHYFAEQQTSFLFDEYEMQTIVTLS